MAALPTGTLTFLFTDIEGSTRLWQEHPTTMPAALLRHDALIREAVEAHGGHVFKTVGDSFCAVFARATDAVGAAASIQRAMHHEVWRETGPIRIRIGLHTGAAEMRGGDYFGPPLNRIARLLVAGHGGQTLLSGATQSLVRDALPPGVSLRDLGERHLRDLAQPEHIYQLVISGLPATFPPLRTLDGRPNNLPTQPTPLIGREREVGDLRRLLLSGQHRLLTLTGPAGSGKTRLAAQVAAEVLDAFADGVFMVPLATVTESELVVPTISAAIGLRPAAGIQDGGGPSALEALRAHLAERRLLLVLDNFEHVLDAAPLVADLLAAAPGLSVVATSQAPLRLPGEREFRVPALATPERVAGIPAVRLARSPSVALFIDRAQAVKPDFRFGEDNAAVIAEICRRLDGLPLAIELAAARIKLLPPAAMLARLQNRLTLLTGGARDLPERQQTLRGAIAWSYDLLDPAERDLFARLAVFVGGATREAVAGVGGWGLGARGCGGAGEAAPSSSSPNPQTPTPSPFGEKSQLRQVEPGGIGVAAETRFVMLETVREFALDRLNALPDADEVRRRHAAFFVALAERAEPHLRGPRRREWLSRLEAEQDNVRAALAWCGERPELRPLAVRLAGALWRFWFGAGHWREGLGHLSRALDACPEAPKALRARAMIGAGHLARLAGRNDEARLRLAEALALCRELGNRPGEGFALGGLGIVAQLEGDYDLAESWLGEALAVVRSVGEPSGVALALYWLGNVSKARGDYTVAVARYEEGLELFRSIGDQAGIAWSLAGLGIAAEMQGQHGAASARLQEALALARIIGDRPATASTLTSLGVVAQHQREPARAAAYFGEALHIARELGDRTATATALGYLGTIAAGRGQTASGASLLGAADALRESAGARFPASREAEFAAAAAALRESLGTATFDAAWSAGRAWPLADAVAEAQRLVAETVLAAAS